MNSHEQISNSEENITLENMKQHEKFRMIVQVVLALRKYATEYNDEKVKEIVREFMNDFDNDKLKQSIRDLENHDAINEYLVAWSERESANFRHAFKKKIKEDPHFLNDYKSMPEVTIEDLEKEVYHSNTQVEDLEEQFDQKAA